MFGKNLFVTVGTTKFDELCNTIFTEECLQTFKKLGYGKLTIQTGNSDIDIENVPLHMLEVDIYKYKPNIVEDMRTADLIISHAGAGTILEVLSMRKPLLVVINTTLMDNHQLEIAEQMHIDKHLYYCTCDTLIDTLETVDFTTLIPYPKANPQLFCQYLNDFMGIRSKR